MNRRAFLGWLGALVPAGAAALWWNRRTPSATGPASTSAPAASATPSGEASGRAASSSGGTRSSAEALSYVGGLPIRSADSAQVGAPCREALKSARALIGRHCTDLAFANAAIHGVRALGRDISFGGGDPYRVLLERYTRETYVEGHVFLEVPVPQEGHRHAMLKTLIEKSCDLDLGFEHETRRYRFRDYVESARLAFRTETNEPVDERSWTLMALARVTSPSRTSWTNVWGHRVDLADLIRTTSATLMQDTQLVRTLDVDMDEVPRNCPAFGRVCGGLHMHYALAVALSCGHGDPQLEVEFARHMQTLVRRFRYDLKVIDQVERLNAERVGAERSAVTAFDARLKFLGHAFEIVGLAQQFDLYAFEPAERVHVDAAREALCRLLVQGQDVDWSAIRADVPLYESVVSGICHAYNGLVWSAA